MADETMEARIKVLEQQVAVQARELEKLKRQPVPPVTTPGDTGKALEAMPEYVVKVDQENGIVGGD